jgi:hypothetical protein
MQVLAKRVEQRGPGIELEPMLDAIDAQRNVERSDCAPGRLRRRGRDGTGQELAAGQSTADRRRNFQKLASRHMGVGHDQDSPV